jgi:hypothetical protein
MATPRQTPVELITTRRVLMSPGAGQLSGADPGFFAIGFQHCDHEFRHLRSLTIGGFARGAQGVPNDRGRLCSAC